MGVIVNLYSKHKDEIKRFLYSFSHNKFQIPNELKWEYRYDNPTESADIIGAFIDNKEKFKINMWVSLDTDFFINVTDYNADKIIRYLYERYPY